MPILSRLQHVDNGHNAGLQHTMLLNLTSSDTMCCLSGTGALHIASLHYGPYCAFIEGWNLFWLQDESLLPFSFGSRSAYICQAYLLRYSADSGCAEPHNVKAVCMDAADRQSAEHSH